MYMVSKMKTTPTHSINDFISDQRIAEIQHDCWLNQTMGKAQMSYIEESITQGRYERALVYLDKSLRHLNALKATLESVRTEGSQG